MSLGGYRHPFTLKTLPCISAAPTTEPAVAVPAGWAAARAGTPCRRGGCTCCCCCSGSRRGSALPAGQRKSALCQCHCVSADIQQWASQLRMVKEIIAQPGLQDRMSTLSAPTTIFLLIFLSLAVLSSLGGNHPEMLSKSSRYMKVQYIGQPPGTAQQHTHSPAHPYPTCLCLPRVQTLEPPMLGFQETAGCWILHWACSCEK